MQSVTVKNLTIQFDVPFDDETIDSFLVQEIIKDFNKTLQLDYPEYLPTIYLSDIKDSDIRVKGLNDDEKF